MVPGQRLIAALTQDKRSKTDTEADAELLAISNAKDKNDQREKRTKNSDARKKKAPVARGCVEVGFFVVT